MKFLYTTIIFISSYAVHECVYSFQSLYLCCACTHWVINLLLYCTAVATRDIEALKMSCTSKKCQWVGELGSLETHLKTCEYVFIICTNICKFNDQLMFILRGKLNTHLTNDCPRRQHKCPHCQEMGEHQERTTTHLKTCPKVKISCSSKLCSVITPRDKHISYLSVCGYQRVHCRYVAVGCQHLPLRKNLEEHEEDYQLHLRVTTDKILELTKLIKQPLIKFKVREFQERKNSYIYSRPFFTFRNGYKMRISVGENDSGDSKATHIPVYAYLMKGPNDESLSWPFTGTVTIELLNQLEDKNHYKERLTFPADSVASLRVVDGERGRGYGCPKFISYTDLDYNADKNTQYLKDDTLVFSVVSVEVPDYKPWLD